MTKKKYQSLRNKALMEFREAGGILRTSEAIRRGIHPEILYELRDQGLLRQVHRGIYALNEFTDLEAFDYAPIVKLAPTGVICLTTALAYHHLTVQIPKWIDVAIPKEQNIVQISHPPTEFHWFSDRVFYSGIEIHNIGGIDVRIYSPEKTIIDCFRQRKKVGAEVALEGLKMYIQTKDWNLKALYQFAKESRVTKIIDPYIEVLIHDQS
ncbi:MAG: type IV toxin-antitoxin system AbiEi family antitoxin domain-containing protein [Simkaniaceae bacterium]|nr:type IV toxin-antitoxin system AbiEi family antitoxin domain-containing protein [Simkaniaceae bacterium]